MNYIYNIIKNIENFLNKNYIILFYNFEKIKFFLINSIKKQNYNTKFFFCSNKIVLSFLGFNYKKTLYLLIHKNNDSVYNLINNINDFLEIKPILIINKYFRVNNLIIEKISKISKENLILEFIKKIKLIIIKLLNLIKNYGKQYCK
ncbi:hypothetical protein [Candidatus Carsonella ruddii]|uniref:Putative ribosomal protein L10 n=1 Tax=Candidatus Carsonella ruddii PC isolate NHV TaxID=1202540 RepID=J3VR42_CARRU|nr:hypothetical protein [Candidatus Carsonella ruddii]AFP84391.1 putative ribosomal protein L10 [Candidatus Carsonella ruddii PC isolate NHV]